MTYCLFVRASSSHNAAAYENLTRGKKLDTENKNPFMQTTECS